METPGWEEFPPGVCRHGACPAHSAVGFLEISVSQRSLQKEALKIFYSLFIK
jgi:hypothetical protein